MASQSGGESAVSGKSTGSVDDAALMTAIAARDDKALALIYERYSAVVFALCLRALARPAAEEVVVDVFWELWDRADRYDASRSGPLAYLMGVTRSRILDKLRSLQARKRQAEPVLDAQATASSNAGPLQYAVLAEQRARITTALSQLPSAQREPLELAFFGALTHSEIADRIGQPLGTVKSRIRQGLIRLRDLLGDEAN